MDKKHKDLEQRRRENEGLAWLALASTEATRGQRKLHTAIETNAWDVADEAYERLCDTLAMAARSTSAHGKETAQDGLTATHPVEANARRELDAVCQALHCTALHCTALHCTARAHAGGG